VTLRWGNGMLTVGALWNQDGVGVSLVWGRRDLMGETVLPWESTFADHVTIVLATGRDIYVHGSVGKTIIARAIGA
jgi:hypothetical protein